MPLTIQDRVALVEDKVVLDAEFFGEPDDTL
jgi:hypothetical protein